MDINCRNCGEPWDINESLTGLNDGGTMQDIVNGRGCPSCHWGKDQVELYERDQMISMAMGIGADLMGDDIDGIASMIDDFDYLGLFDEDFDEFEDY